MFTAFDEALRDLGSGDMGIPRRIKAMASAFYGRIAAYESAPSEQAMREALSRNVYRGTEGVAGEAQALAHYVFSARNSLERSDLAKGEADFGALPG